MSRPSILGTICGEAESSWGEDVTTFATRYPVLERVDLSGLTQESIEPGRVVQYRNDNTKQINGPMGGTFTTKFHLTGHGSTTSGATTATSIPTLLAKVFGAVATGVTGTTASAGTAAALTTAASGTFAPGQMFRLGALGDAKGAGQWGAVGTHVTTTLTPLFACAGAPTSSDVVYSAETVYTSEAPSGSAVVGHRFLLQTANLTCEAHGCFASAVSFGGLNAGEVPYIEVTWTVSWWRFSTATFPSVVSVETFTPVPVGGGSFCLGTFAATTRTTYAIREFAVDYTLGVAPLMGPTGVNAYQTIVGAVKTPDAVTITFGADADAPTTTPALTALWDANAEMHALYSMSTVTGAAMGMYFSRIFRAGPRPTQADGEGVNRAKLSFKLGTSTTTTSELTLSAFRMGFA